MNRRRVWLLGRSADANLGQVPSRDGRPHEKGRILEMRPHQSIFVASYLGGSGFVAVPAGFAAGLDAAPVGLLLAPAGLVGAATPDCVL